MTPIVHLALMFASIIVVGVGVTWIYDRLALRGLQRKQLASSAARRVARHVAQTPASRRIRRGPTLQPSLFEVPAVPNVPARRAVVLRVEHRADAA